MMTETEQRIHNALHHLSVGQQAEAYHNLMEGVRSRVDAEMMAFTFEQSKLHLERQEQVARAAVAQGLGTAG